jgi:hypothetical protein
MILCAAKDMASSSLRINGRGEAFTRGVDCACWERNRAYDGLRSDGDLRHHVIAAIDPGAKAALIAQ